MLKQIQVIFPNQKNGTMYKFKRIDVVGGNNMEMVNKVILINVYSSTTSWSRSRIQLTLNKFKLIRFNDSKRGQEKNQ